jgi:hypothetical protein
MLPQAQIKTRAARRPPSNIACYYSLCHSHSTRCKEIRRWRSSFHFEAEFPTISNRFRSINPGEFAFRCSERRVTATVPGVLLVYHPKSKLENKKQSVLQGCYHNERTPSLDLGRTWTCNLRIRRPVPYPIWPQDHESHGVLVVTALVYICYWYFSCVRHLSLTSRRPLCRITLRLAHPSPRAITHYCRDVLCVPFSCFPLPIIRVTTGFAHL